VGLDDQFTSGLKTFDVKSVEHLCVPVDKNDEGIKRPKDNLLCYKIKAAKKQPKFEKVKKVYSLDQLESLVQDLSDESEACLPATIAGTEPMCAGNMCEEGGECTSGFCQDSGNGWGVCAAVCADPMSTCVCGSDCTSSFCDDSNGSPRRPVDHLRLWRRLHQRPLRRQPRLTRALRPQLRRPLDDVCVWR
jgi:hypothetical protein